MFFIQSSPAITRQISHLRSMREDASVKVSLPHKRWCTIVYLFIPLVRHKDPKQLGRLTATFNIFV
jgi:hypothetical protein